jgi:hypothetical protein
MSRVIYISCVFKVKTVILLTVKLGFSAFSYGTSRDYCLAQSEASSDKTRCGRVSRSMLDVTLSRCVAAQPTRAFVAFCNPPPTKDDDDDDEA